MTEEAEELGLEWALEPCEPLAKYQFVRLELRLRSLSFPLTKVFAARQPKGRWEGGGQDKGRVKGRTS